MAASCFGQLEGFLSLTGPLLCDRGSRLRKGYASKKDAGHAPAKPVVPPALICFARGDDVPLGGKCRVAHQGDLLLLGCPKTGELIGVRMLKQACIVQEQNIVEVDAPGASYLSLHLNDQAEAECLAAELQGASSWSRSPRKTRPSASSATMVSKETETCRSTGSDFSTEGLELVETVTDDCEQASELEDWVESQTRRSSELLMLFEKEMHWMARAADELADRRTLADEEASLIDALELEDATQQQGLCMLESMVNNLSDQCKDLENGDGPQHFYIGDEPSRSGASSSSCSYQRPITTNITTSSLPSSPSKGARSSKGKDNTTPSSPSSPSKGVRPSRGKNDSTPSSPNSPSKRGWPSKGKEDIGRAVEIAAARWEAQRKLLQAKSAPASTEARTQARSPLRVQRTLRSREQKSLLQQKQAMAKQNADKELQLTRLQNQLQDLRSYQQEHCLYAADEHQDEEDQHADELPALSPSARVNLVTDVILTEDSPPAHDHGMEAFGSDEPATTVERNGEDQYADALPEFRPSPCAHLVTDEVRAEEFLPAHDPGMQTSGSDVLDESCAEDASLACGHAVEASRFEELAAGADDICAGDSSLAYDHAVETSRSEEPAAATDDIRDEDYSLTRDYAVEASRFEELAVVMDEHCAEDSSLASDQAVEAPRFEEPAVATDEICAVNSSPAHDHAVEEASRFEEPVVATNDICAGEASFAHDHAVEEASRFEEPAVATDEICAEDSSSAHDHAVEEAFRFEEPATSSTHCPSESKNSPVVRRRSLALELYGPSAWLELSTPEHIASSTSVTPPSNLPGLPRPRSRSDSTASSPLRVPQRCSTLEPERLPITPVEDTELQIALQKRREEVESKGEDWTKEALPGTAAFAWNGPQNWDPC